MPLRDQERRKLVRDLNRFCNDRARLEHALRVVLGRHGLGKVQVNNIVADVRKADFKSLGKAIKLKEEKTDGPY